MGIISNENLIPTGWEANPLFRDHLNRINKIISALPADIDISQFAFVDIACGSHLTPDRGNLDSLALTQTNIAYGLTNEQAKSILSPWTCRAAWSRGFGDVIGVDLYPQPEFDKTNGIYTHIQADLVKVLRNPWNLVELISTNSTLPVIAINCYNFLRLDDPSPTLLGSMRSHNPKKIIALQNNLKEAAQHVLFSYSSIKGRTFFDF